ncbi:hypothetical protein [Streptomyces sp. NPDC020607]|uniref:hypothetical protein n=1 Tax=Streptomyces sp. NPDC020607 TaxID=3365082 RepID=UPI003792AF4C
MTLHRRADFCLQLRDADLMTIRGWGMAAAAWSMVAVLLAGATVWVGTLGLVRLGLVGDEVQVRLTQCQLEGGGCGGSHVECSGQLAAVPSADTVLVRYDGEPGEVVHAARTPWGTFEVVDKGFTSWGTAALYPLLPLGAVVMTVCLAVRCGRRGKRQTTPGVLRG